MAEQAQPMTEISLLGTKSDGYIVIAPLSDATLCKIKCIQKEISEKLPANSLWLPNEEQLHVTFAHIISPDKVYPTSKSSLWEQLQSPVNNALKNVVSKFDTTVMFNKVSVFPSAIIITGVEHAKDPNDNGFRNCRQTFINGFDLPTESRRPPEIIHATIARFKIELPLNTVNEAVEKIEINFLEQFNCLQLIHETKPLGEKFEVIRSYTKQLDQF
jgi:hypothetical protein